MELQLLINDIYEEMDYSSISEKRRRYLNGYLQELLSYQINNPNCLGIPNSLQLYCNSNPEGLECRIYE
jgi:hypothetical protein